MSSLINYLFEANVALTLFAAFYWLVLFRETDFQLKRYFILLAVVISLAVPLVDMSGFGNSYAGVISDMPTIMLPAVEIGNDQLIAQETASTVAWWRWAVVGYFLVSFALLVLLANQVYRIAQIIRTKRSEQRGSYTMVYTDGQFPTFSFFHWLFFDDSVALTDKEKAKIIAHEEVHIRQWHSLDIILVEILRLICWVNPAAWWMRKELEETHEYLADEQLVKATQFDDYSALLAKMALQKLSISLGNHFNKSLTIKRIKMMKTIKSKMKTWKASTAFALLVVVFVAFSCNEDVVQEMTEVLNTSTMAAMPDDFKPELERLQAKYPAAKFTYVESDMNNESSLKAFREIDQATIGYMKVLKDSDGEQRIGMLVNSAGKINELQFKTFESEDEADEIFTIVENQPEPVAGMQNFYMNIAKTLKYPSEARKAGVQGKVFVQFVVNEDGSLSKITVVKGIGHGCDEEAVNAIANAGEWKPGLQRGRAVKVRMILPITFKLGDVPSNGEDKSLGANQSKDGKTMESVVVVGYGSN